MDDYYLASPSKEIENLCLVAKMRLTALLENDVHTLLLYLR
jgi:hypothetical protein